MPCPLSALVHLLVKLFCTACRTNVMWTFLFATCLAYTAWHYRQCIMRTALCGTCFTCFTFWRCHFLSFLCYNCFILVKSLQFARKNFAHHLGTCPRWCLCTRCPTSVVYRHLRGPNVLHVLLRGQFHVRDVRMHLCQLVSDDQQSSFHLYQPVCRLHH